MIYAFLIALVLFVVMLLLFICQHKTVKELKEQLGKSTEMYIGLQEEFELYRNAERFKQKKEEEANEKIDDLHSGKLSADDILPKR